jgi:hypothetical protein
LIELFVRELCGLEVEGVVVGVHGMISMAKPLDFGFN